MDTANRFARYLRFRSVLDDPHVELDLSYSALQAGDVEALAQPLHQALAAMRALEGGCIAKGSHLAAAISRQMRLSAVLDYF